MKETPYQLVVRSQSTEMSSKTTSKSYLSIGSHLEIEYSEIEFGKELGRGSYGIRRIRVSE